MQAILMRKIKGHNIHFSLENDEFVVVNDDTYEVWTLNGMSIKEFKKEYCGFYCANNKIVGSYPRYQYFENN